MAASPDGWMPGVEQIRTQDYGYASMPDDGMYPFAVMSHVMQGYQSTMDGWARQTGIGKSIHFSVSRTGRIVQYVSIWDPAWHAGYVNSPSWTLYPALSASRGANPNLYTVGIEHEGFSIVPPYSYDYLYGAARPWPAALVDASIRIHRFVFDACNRYGDWIGQPGEKNVITHSMVDKANRPQDPGDLWLSAVRPAIISALQPAPPPPARTYDDGLRDGRAEGRLTALDDVAAAVARLRAA